MAQIRNLSRVVQRVTDKAGKTTDIAPGETEPVNVDPENVRFAAKVRSRLVEIVEKTTATAASRPKSAAARKPKPKPAAKAAEAVPSTASEIAPAT